MPLSILPNQWTERFRGLAGLPLDLKAKLTHRAVPIQVDAKHEIFGPGHAPEHVLLLIEGRIRVQQVSEQGREIVLYRVEAGESCVMTTACLLAYEDYMAQGIAETDVLCAGIPKIFFEELLATSEAFRHFVFLAYSKRMTDLFHVIDEVAFKRIDIRLAGLLVRMEDRFDGPIAVTQQDLAFELGSAREVISRQLQEFKKRGWLELGRGSISLNDTGALRALAQH